MFGVVKKGCTFTSQTTTIMKNQEKEQWFWVSGDHVKGFKIHTKQPRHKFVREPFQSREACQRFIALEWLLNS